MTIFESYTNEGPSATSIFCAQGWSAFTVHRTLFPPTSTSTSASTTSSSTTTAAITSSPQFTTTQPSQTSTSSSPTNTPVSPDPAPESKAWIAGAVVGAVAGLAILAGFAWFIYRRRQNKRSDEKQPDERYSSNALLGFHEGSPIEMSADPSHHEMANTLAAQELDGRYKGAAVPRGPTAPGLMSPQELDASSLRSSRR
ncbi:hypothetical protein N7539_005453 [Penicillium diatomitis]|uniref:Uncharacterized protein n=1 Tax=Penicillium diatomitis TaxID=2819901 RepID=A0A9W9X6W6_9EURO|nr:uncharacterized protein N7539_005453 [Penicillium diatomitis]KAJ5485465.1 hypothetical protein N7539_005453 [Penicillium diatomitis]